jgi:hypothetical protein
VSSTSRLCGLGSLVGFVVARVGGLSRCLSCGLVEEGPLSKIVHTKGWEEAFRNAIILQLGGRLGGCRKKEGGGEDKRANGTSRPGGRRRSWYWWSRSWVVVWEISLVVSGCRRALAAGFCLVGGRRPADFSFVSALWEAQRGFALERGCVCGPATTSTSWEEGSGTSEFARGKALPPNL